jgi:hypothetical protein
MVDYWTPLRDAVKHKASRYGRLRQPYLVAINALDQDADQIDVMQALFGQETIVIERGNSDNEPRPERLPNGAWLAKKGPINTRVSGVLVVGSLLPWSVGVRRPIVYYNPWAAYPLDDSLDWLDAQLPREGKMVKRDGWPLTKILRLPPAWPPEMVSDSHSPA